MDLTGLACELGMLRIEANACYIASLAYDRDESGELDIDEEFQAFAGAMVDMSSSETMKWNVHYDNGETNAYTREQFAMKFGASRCHGVGLCTLEPVHTNNHRFVCQLCRHHRKWGASDGSILVTT